ncbi:MAG: gliding motility-associated ABC transporter ATP-binding subunit GldA [Bacteroidales bacterium]|jgi:ABC-2 type transport system ATP-binding protein|nr:gliding motility-associated ABC transporter ATP-binding subunit GldA [Bacteroidales bacterium]MCK9499241.1 gliding motility-associated ABC transporter ATP-binding subunit GldA [Bacteroidales bacterium]MDY0314553.1 gliding motility-associated ABC transporter ATP-binding subunit GldA [Bacteroidales bacterium]NLB85792.1 gliding motility-associated ABC transporter ATP-binding subunit GldA [Bacteroidales bacterium]
MSIKVQNITKIFGQQKALDNVSFEIESGEIVGFLGPNGAGKSTMMKIITGFIPANNGEVFINNKNIVEEQNYIKRVIGYLPEQNPLYYDMYVLEFLRFIAGIYSLPNKKARINEVIELTGLIPEMHKKISALSKGYKQRVGLAQAIIHNPQVLILDEPTSGLDPNQIVEIRNLIKDLGKSKTVLLSTHIMQEVEAICDRVLIINKGLVVADNSIKGLQTKLKIKVRVLNLETLKPVDEKKVKAIAGVLQIQNLGNNNYNIEFDASKDIRQDIFNFVVKDDNTVLSLQLKEQSLEQVFTKLTSRLK